MNTEKMIRLYTRSLKAQNRNPDSVEWYVCMLERFLAYIDNEGITSLRQVTAKTMQGYQHYVHCLTNRKGNPYSGRAINLHLTAVRSFFRFMQIRGSVKHDPTTALQYAKPSKTLPKDILTTEEMKTLLRQPDANTPLGLRDRTIMEVLYSTGMRRAELLSLDIGDVCMDSRTIRVFGKGRKERIVPFGKIAQKCLRAYLRSSRPTFASRSSMSALFLSRRGVRLGKQGLKHLVDKYAAEAGLRTKVTPHIFRHCCATHILEGGADVEFDYTWGGRLCLARNGVPAFGEVETGLFSACCQNGVGVAKGTLSGIMAARLATGTDDPMLAAMLAHDQPRRLPPEPLAWIGANATIRWKEHRAGREF